jgi:hypothetical protein
MSHWTHIIAAIDIDTYHQDKDIKSYVENILANAPKITGSEGPADVFVNVKSGHNHWTSCDCNSCEFKDTIISYSEEEGGGWSCGAPNGFTCPEGEYQTRVVITVLGDLRDRERWRTRDEWYAFREYVKARIGCGYDFRNCVCRIHD